MKKLTQFAALAMMAASMGQDAMMSDSRPNHIPRKGPSHHGKEALTKKQVKARKKAKAAKKARKRGK